VPSQPHACRARVGEKQRVVGGKIAQRRGQELRTDGLDLRSFHDVVLQHLVERFRLRDVLVEKAATCLVTHAAKQGSDRGLNIAHQPKVNVGSPANVLGVLVDLNFLDTIARKKFRKRKVRAQQQ
jgi:hypothetical protein